LTVFLSDSFLGPTVFSLSQKYPIRGLFLFFVFCFTSMSYCWHIGGC
jgi:hypothetical protein